MAGDVFMIPQQLNGTYYPEEDRLMLRIRTNDNSEYRLWLTRLITQKILAVIEKISIKNIEARNKDKALPRGIAETMDEMIRYPIRTPFDGDEMEPCVIAGPTCDSVDVLYEKEPYMLPISLEIGAKVLIEGTGAYTTTYSAVGFKSHVH
jgi:hypothetical protein